MRHWWRESTAAAGAVADRPLLWLPGALAWTVTIGWAALVIGVGRPLGDGELTFIGAGIFASGAWPWNLVAIGVAGFAVALLAFALASAGEAALLRGARATTADIRHLFVLGVVCAAPVLVGLLALATATVIVGPAEFNAPNQELGPVARTALRLSPILVTIAVAASAGAAIHAAAARSVVAGRTAAGSLRGAPRALARTGISALVQASALLVARIIYLVICAILLRVLWAPIGIRLAEAGIDAAVALLLVGFVAIWLCLLLGGGALHAWGSVSWTRVLGARVTEPGGSRERMESSTGP
jgi:hypothetical protein